MYQNNYMLDKLTRQKEEIDNLINAYQTTLGNIPVLCKYGNEILANQINKRINYPIGYGNQNSNYTNGQFVILSCRCLNPRGTETTTELSGVSL